MTFKEIVELRTSLLNRFLLIDRLGLAYLNKKRYMILMDNLRNIYLVEIDYGIPTFHDNIMMREVDGDNCFNAEGVGIIGTTTSITNALAVSNDLEKLKQYIESGKCNEFKYFIW